MIKVPVISENILIENEHMFLFNECAGASYTRASMSIPLARVAWPGRPRAGSLSNDHCRVTTIR
jgi:hypothetical protein